MKICFVAMHHYWGGLANNGGSKTIIRSAEALRLLGCDVEIAAVNDRHTWIKHPKILKKIPGDADILIANSVSDIDIVLKAKKKFWWCRGLELWQASEKRIIEKSKKINVIVNSSWLLKKFPDAKLCYSGLDLYTWRETRQRNYSQKLTIGCLWSRSHKTKRYDIFKKIKKHFGERFNYETLKDKFNDDELVRFYNECDIWLAPTELEGWHNCPAEANLCGCLVICNRLDSNGMDYATEETAMRFTGFDELLACIENPDFSKVEKMKKVLHNKIGNRENNMKKFIDIITRRN